MSVKSRYLTAQEAAAMLGIKRATLYAYVSRGLVRSEQEGENDNPRARRYLADDVAKLVKRKEQRHDPTTVAKDALHWGTPILESSITLITDQRLYYRGYDAAVLARERSLEEVAGLIWTGEMDAIDPSPGGHRLPFSPHRQKDNGAFAQLEDFRLTSHPADGVELPPIQRLQVALAVASAEDLRAYDLSAEAVAATGARILQLMADVLVRTNELRGTIAETLAYAWRTEDAALINAALILCADHELNASSFAARVVASVEANPYAVVVAGLGALQGIKHGGNTERVTALLREVGEPQYAHAVITERLRRGERIPGFGHRLYPDGDPRAHTLLEMLAEVHPESPALALGEAIMQETTPLIEHHINVDFALAVLEQALKLPRGSALALFALGRTVGWIGQAIEQYATDQIIRPRARYVGRMPQK